MTRTLVDKVKEALKNVDNGDPLKDFLEDYEIIEALRLLAKLERLSTELSSIAASDPTPEMLKEAFGDMEFEGISSKSSTNYGI